MTGARGEIKTGERRSAGDGCRARNRKREELDGGPAESFTHVKQTVW